MVVDGDENNKEEEKKGEEEAEWAPFNEIEVGWRMRLIGETRKGYFSSLTAYVDRERRSGSTPIYPPEDEVFSMLNECPFEDVKVVVIGQDPYHGPGSFKQEIKRDIIILF